MSQTAAKKSTAKKTPAKRKPAAKKKPVARKKAVSKTKATAKKTAKKADNNVSELFDKFQERAEQARENGKKAGLAYLGMYGAAFDFAKEQYQKAVDANEGRFDEWVKRGEVVQKDAKARIEDLELPEFDADKMSESVKQRIESLKEQAEEMMDTAQDRIEELRERVAPSKA